MSSKKSSSQRQSVDKEDEAARVNIKSSKLLAVLNNDLLFGESVRRSPRAPARVKTNFNDVFSKDSGTKKRASESTTQGCDADEESTVPASFPGPMDTPDGRKVDAHCWLCHRVKPNQEPEDLSYCIKCVRVFHFECLGGTQRFNDEGLCPQCKITSLDGTKLHDSLTRERLAQLLTYALNTTMKNAAQLKQFKYSEKQSQDLVYPVDLLKLLENIEKQCYETTATFLSDVKWILHNLMILPRVNRTLISNARKFMTDCRGEMLDIEACPDCYAHMHSLKPNWFSKLCNVNHTLVWAKIKGFPYWPAKVLKVIDGVADVRFFGTHEKALLKVPSENCYWLSKESPNHKMPQQSLFKVALEELAKYIKNVQNGYGPIEYHPLETKYDPVAENICTKQVNRKREHSNSGPPAKPKRQKTESVPLKNSSADQSNRESVAKETSSPAVLNGSKEISVVPSAKSATDPPEKHTPSKKGTVVSSPDNTVSDEIHVSVPTVESSAADKTVHKNATKLNGPRVAPPCVSKKHSGSSCLLHSPKAVNPVSFTKQGAKSKSSCVGRTKTKKPEMVPDQLNTEPGISTDSASSNNNLADESHSVSETNSCNKTAEPPAENSEAGDQDVTVVEEISDNSERTFVPEQVSVDSASVSVEENMPSSANTEEPTFGSSAEVLNPANMLEFYEEEMDNQNDLSYESAATPTYGHSSDNAESRHVRRPRPFSVEVISNENMEPSNSHQQPCHHCLRVHASEYPQEDRYICTMPLPEELNVKKYQDVVNTTIRATVEEIWHDYVNSRNVQNLLFRAQQEKEDMEVRFKKEAEEVAKNTNLIISSMVKKHAEALEALRRKCEKEKEEVIKEYEKKLQCSQCGKESVFICCGDDSCCDHPCQKTHRLVEQLTSSSHVNSSGDTQSPDSSVCNSRKTWNKEQSRGNHSGLVTAKKTVRSSHCTSQKTSAATFSSTTGVPSSSTAQSRTDSGVASNKGQALSSSQHTTSSHRFVRPHLAPLPPLTPSPEAVLNRSSSVPPDSSLRV